MKKHLLQIVLLIVVGVPSIQNLPSEFMLKAGYIEKFTQFITWPEEAILNNPSQVFEIVVLGEKSITEELELMFSKSSKIKEIKIRNESQVDQIGLPHILFITNKMNSQLESVLEMTSNQPILTIGDTKGFCEDGVMINFYMDNNKVRFEINKKIIQDRGLTISHLLLGYATKVISE